MKHTLDTLFKKISSTGDVSFPFLIIEAQQGLGAFGYVREQISKMLGLYQQDLLALEDLAVHLEIKKHAIKVSVPGSDQAVHVGDGYASNLGAREISQRLSIASAGPLKIVLIEGIERMTTGAANALLKNFEEPLPGRLIVATTTNAEGLLDTIRSRAFVIRAVPPRIELLLKQNSGHIEDSSLLLSGVALSGGDQLRLNELLGDKETLQQFDDLSSEVLGDGAGYRVVQLRKLLGERYSDSTLLDALMLRSSIENTYSSVALLMRAQKMIGANVGSDNVWYGLGVKHEIE